MYQEKCGCYVDCEQDVDGVCEEVEDQQDFVDEFEEGDYGSCDFCEWYFYVGEIVDGFGDCEFEDFLCIVCGEDGVDDDVQDEEFQ